MDQHKEAAMATGRKCFVISPIGEPDSPTRKRADQVLRHVIAPAAEECGYDPPQRADKMSAPGLITAQVVQAIIEADMVVADLTDHNANVFYELAIRHLYRKPVVQIIAAGQPIPFDVSPVRTIKLDHTDLDSAADARRDLVAQMKSADADPSLVDSPISVAIDLEALRAKGTSEEKALVRLLEDISARLAAIERRDANEVRFVRTPRATPLGGAVGQGSTVTVTGPVGDWDGSWRLVTDAETARSKRAGSDAPNVKPEST
jgi:hypothetical protein